MDRKEYKKVMSGIRPSEKAVERIMDMTDQKKKKRIKFAPAVAIAACFVIAATAVFSGTGQPQEAKKLNKEISQNIFTVAAYAKGADESEEQKIDIGDTPVATTSMALELTEENGVKMVVKASTGFKVEGKNIETVTYSAEHGRFSYQSLVGNDFVTSEEMLTGKDKSRYGGSLTIDNIGGKEIMEVYYNADEAVDILLNENEDSVEKFEDYDYSILPGDVITISVKFKDGSSAQKKIKVSYSNAGLLMLRYAK